MVQRRIPISFETTSKLVKEIGKRLVGRGNEVSATRGRWYSQASMADSRRDARWETGWFDAPLPFHDGDTSRSRKCTRRDHSVPESRIPRELLIHRGLLNCRVRAKDRGQEAVEGWGWKRGTWTRIQIRGHRSWESFNRFANWFRSSPLYHEICGLSGLILVMEL